MDDFSKYVKPVDGGWEVKLGAGSLPFVLTKSEFDYFSIASYGTSSIPSFIGDTDDFSRKAKGYSAVKQYLSANGKMAVNSEKR
jgi:hypothetical protein